MERVCAIFGDVHGEADLLRELIRKIKEKYPEAELYSVGDLIDRGPKSREVLEVCIQEKIQAIIGNHDQYLQDLILEQEFEEYALKPIMGGAATIKSFGLTLDDFSQLGRTGFSKKFFNAVSQEIKDYVKDLPPYRFLELDGKKYWLLHAGLIKSVASGKKKGTSDHQLMKQIEKENVNAILWMSPDLTEGNDNLYHFKNAVQIFGHRPVRSPIIKDHFIALDTGCGTCEPWTLSAVILPTMEIIQVSNQNVWI